MANYANLKAAVQAVIKTNGNNEITGAILQSTLLSLINSIGDDYLFAGVATPSTNPGSPDQNVFYLGGAGVYANFGTSITVPDGSICLFKYNGSWTKELCNVGSGAFNVSKANAVGGVYATYSTLSDALNAVPSSSRQGGMTIIYIDEDSQEYVQYRLMNKNWSNNIADWQGVDVKPISGSKNFVESGDIWEWVQNTNWFASTGTIPLITKNNNNSYTITTSAVISIFGSNDNYGAVAAGTWILPVNYYLVLSTAPDSVVNPLLKGTAAGVTYYLHVINRESLQYENKVIAANIEGNLFTKNDWACNNVKLLGEFQDLYKFKNNNWFIQTSQLPSITLSNDNCVITSGTNLLILGAGGDNYGTVAAGTWIISSGNYYLVLSEDENSVVNPTLDGLSANISYYLIAVPRENINYSSKIVAAYIGGKLFTKNDWACNTFEILTTVQEIKNDNWYLGISQKPEITISNDSCTITAHTIIFVLGVNGCYGTIAAGSWTLPYGNYFLVLSENSDSIVTPTLESGSGVTYYLIPIRREDLKYNYKVVAVWMNNKLYTKDDWATSQLDYALRISIEQRTHYLLSKAPIIQRNGDDVSFTFSNIISIFDVKGGYRFVAAGTYTLHAARNFYLSTTENTFTAPDLSVKGTGQYLYLVERQYSDGLNECLVVANNGGLLYSPYNFITEALVNEELIPIINDNTIRESQGILPRESFERTPILLNAFNHILKKDKDVTIIHLGDSISTNNYASARSDAAYRPPRMDEYGLPTYVEEQLRWRGQQYRRSDAKTVEGGETAMFTEIGTGEDKYYDAAWDWQFEELSQNYYRLWTRVLTGTAGTPASVTFTIPAGTKNFAFIYRTDYLCAASAQVILSANNIARIKQSDGTLVEANGYSFSMKEVDEILTKTFTQYDGNTVTRTMRKSRGQVRLDFHIDNTSSDIIVTIANTGAGRLNYWGVEYTTYDHMFRYINMARGGHNMDALKCFEPWDVDLFKPDMIIYQCPIINEGAMSLGEPAVNTPPAFAQRFVTRFTELKQKSYAPELLSYVLYIGIQANIVDQETGKYNCSYIYEYGYIDTYKYIGFLEDSLKDEEIDFINCFNRFDDIAYRKAQNEGTNNIYVSAIQGSGANGNTFTNDNIHLNSYGSLIAWRLLKKYFNV